MVGMAGLEPATSALSGPRSYQLSYTPTMAAPLGFEPRTPRLTAARSGLTELRGKSAAAAYASPGRQLALSLGPDTAFGDVLRARANTRHHGTPDRIRTGVSGVRGRRPGPRRRQEHRPPGRGTQSRSHDKKACTPSCRSHRLGGRPLFRAHDSYPGIVWRVSVLELHAHPPGAELVHEDGPGDWIRTSGRRLPKPVPYQAGLRPDEDGGDDGARTHDVLLARQVLSQLSYAPR